RGRGRGGGRDRGSARRYGAAADRSTSVAPVPAGESLHPEPVVTQGLSTLLVAGQLGHHAHTLELSHGAAIAGAAMLDVLALGGSGGDGVRRHDAEGDTHTGNEKHSTQASRVHLTEFNHLPILLRNGSPAWPPRVRHAGFSPRARHRRRP